jgi:hypothetical protein
VGWIKDRLEELYPNTRWYGVYRDKEGRGYVVCAEIDSSGRTPRKGKKFSMSFARAKMQAKLGRILGPDEEVDHRDTDHTNDAYHNLQVLTKGEHRRKSNTENEVLRSKYRWVNCPNCGVLFQCELYRAKIAIRKNKKPCCSRSCSASFYGANQSGSYR